MKTKLRSISIGLLMLSMTFGTAQIKDPQRKTPDYENLGPIKNKLCNASNVHKNFKDIVAWIDQTDRITYYDYLVQVTTVNPCPEQANSNTPTYYYTSWSTGGLVNIDDNCTLSLMNAAVFYSDRDTFKGNTDVASYVFDLKNNSVEVTSHTWGDGKTVFRDLKRVKNTIYHLGSDGSMTIFNLCPTKGPIIQ